MSGLTPDGRVDPAQLHRLGQSTGLLRCLANRSAIFSRRLDWTNRPQHLLNGTQKNAAVGQQVGTIAPEGKECFRCQVYPCTFKSCVLSTYNVSGEAKIMFPGTCMDSSAVFVRSLPVGSKKLLQICHIQVLLLPHWVSQIIHPPRNARLLFVIPCKL
jgi:hypothetical protein